MVASTVARNEIFEQFPVRTDRRVLAPSQPAIVDSSMPSFCASCSWVSPRVHAKPLQFSDQVVCFRQGIVPKKGDNPRKAMHHRLNFVAFPVDDRRRIDSKLFRYLLLKKAKIQPSFSDVISQCFQVLRVGFWLRFWP